MSEIERWVLVTSTLLLYGLLCWVCVRRYRARCRIQLPPVSEPGPDTLLVAWASQSGRAMELAQQTAAAQSGPVQLLPLAQVDGQVLAACQRALFIVSTYGEGEAPDNGAPFVRRCLNNRALDLSSLQFSVLALGDRRYPDFCAFGHRLDSGLQQLGAERLSEPTELDAAEPERSHHAWHQWLQGCQQTWQLAGQSAPCACPVCVPVVQPQLAWALSERSQINTGSPGEPLYWLRFQSPAGTVCDWRAGDLVELALPDHPQQPRREYTIASLASDGQLELLVRQQRHADGSLGLASGWLTRDAPLGAAIRLQIRANPLFRAPEPQLPLILIGNGSGFAGLRALLRERETSGGRENWLLFGERCPQADCLFAEEVQGWQQRGFLPRLDRAFSRSAESPAYVQDCLQAEPLRDWLARGAVIMVCGSREGMATGVDARLRQLLGDEAVEQLISEDRYRRDVY